MYCPSCGAESTPGLKYCKRCGLNLGSPASADAPQKIPTGLTIAFLVVIFLIALPGLIMPVIVASEMAGQGTNIDNLMPLFALAPLATIGIVVLLVWLLLRLIKMAQGSEPRQVKEVRQAELTPMQMTPAQITAPPESVGSVTEHTTRNFDSLKNRAPSRSQDRDTQ